MTQSARSGLVLVVGGIVLLAAGRFVTTLPGYRVPKDFSEYWAAGRLALHGENPYNPALLLAEERRVEPDRAEPLMMWNPPPALALYLPVGVLPFREAGLLWVGGQFLAVLAACDLLGRLYNPTGPPGVRRRPGGRPPTDGGNRRRPGGGLGSWSGFLFVGTWWMVAYGQNTGLLLLGLAGYLHFLYRGRPLAAGGCAALAALKPHLLLGFGVLLLADAGTRRGRLVLLGGGSAILAALGVALFADPHVIGQYLAATRNPGPGATPLTAWELPVPAYWLRKAVAFDRFWVQFLPCGVVCVALLVWRVAARGRWDWANALPFVVAASALAAPYGWTFDWTVLLVPVVWAVSRAAAGRRWALVVGMLAGQVAVLAVSLAKAGEPGFMRHAWWIAPSVLLLCLPAFGVPRTVAEEGKSGPGEDTSRAVQ
jgi:hypothetical protein